MLPKLNTSITETRPWRRLRTPVAAIALSAGLLGAGGVADGALAHEAPPAAAANAAEDAKPDVGFVHGEITAVDGSTVTVDTRKGEEPVAVDPDAVVLLSTKTDDGWTTTPGDVADLAAGQRIWAVGSQADDGSTVVRFVFAVNPEVHTPESPAPITKPVVEKPETPEAPAATEAHVAGAVTSVSAAGFVVQAKDGTSVTVVTDADTTFGGGHGRWHGHDDKAAPAGFQAAKADRVAADLSSIEVGDRVNVAGTTQADGSVLADAVWSDQGHDCDRDGEAGERPDVRATSAGLRNDGSGYRHGDAAHHDRAGQRSDRGEGFRSNH